jgi:hypothetical protein
MSNSIQRPATRLERWIPRLILIAAGLHLAVAFPTGHWGDILRDGLWNTVGTDDAARMSTLWITMAGIGLAGLGLLARKAVLSYGTLPTETGWILLALGIPIAVLDPISGGWMLIGIGVLAVIAARRNKTRRIGIAEDYLSPSTRT